MIKVAILGYGTVGSGVVEVLTTMQGLSPSVPDRK